LPHPMVISTLLTYAISISRRARVGAQGRRALGPPLGSRHMNSLFATSLDKVVHCNSFVIT
jgi:hypothetical protein